jgi:uncharacterized membrane protein
MYFALQKTRTLAKNRDLIKTITFAVMHFSVAFLVTWALTGDILIGTLVAMVEPAINTVAYYFHEKIWGRINSRKADDNADSSRAFVML